MELTGNLCHELFMERLGMHMLVGGLYTAEFGMVTFISHQTSDQLLCPSG